MPATTTATRSQDGSTTARMHPLAESVLALTRNSLWLIRPLHWDPPLKSQKKSPAGRADARSRNGWADYTFVF